MKDISQETVIKIIRQSAIILRMHAEVAGDRICQDWSGKEKLSPESVFTKDELDSISYHYEMHNSSLEDYEEGRNRMNDEMIASFAMARMLDLIADHCE